VSLLTRSHGVCLARLKIDSNCFYVFELGGGWEGPRGNGETYTGGIAILLWGWSDNMYVMIMISILCLVSTVEVIVSSIFLFLLEAFGLEFM